MDIPEYSYPGPRYPVECVPHDRWVLVERNWFDAVFYDVVSWYDSESSLCTKDLVSRDWTHWYDLPTHIPSDPQSRSNDAEAQWLEWGGAV